MPWADDSCPFGAAMQKAKARQNIQKIDFFHKRNSIGEKRAGYDKNILQATRLVFLLYFESCPGGPEILAFLVLSFSGEVVQA
jgi:hypothetical protein